jgi:menaquinol-cytochrome c reductase iron-sulfur subunit
MVADELVEERGGTGRDVNRRTFLGYLAGAFAAFIGTSLGLPVLGYLAAPLARKETGTWLTLGKTNTFAPGEPRLVSLSIARQDGWRRITESRTAWVVASDDGDFTVFNGRCTHLGCAYSFKTDGPHAGSFFCPCHDGVYDQDGSVASGPPPRPLDQLDYQVNGDELQVLYQDFRLGVADREAV